jgi:hypothetical protein
VLDHLPVSMFLPGPPPGPPSPLYLTWIIGTTTYLGGATGIERQLETERHRRGRQCREIRGAAPYPLLGEDAQTWVPRTRREGDEDRCS